MSADSGNDQQLALRIRGTVRSALCRSTIAGTGTLLHGVPMAVDVVEIYSSPAGVDLGGFCC